MVNLFHKLFFIPVEPSVLIKRTVGLHEGGAREAGQDRGGEVGQGRKGQKGGGRKGRGGGGDRGGGEDRGGGGGDKGGGTRRECGLCILLLTVILVFISIGGTCEHARGYVGSSIIIFTQVRDTSNLYTY